MTSFHGGGWVFARFQPIQYEAEGLPVEAMVQERGTEGRQPLILKVDGSKVKLSVCGTCRRVPKTHQNLKP